MKALTAHPVDTGPLGYFRIFAQPPGGRRREITVFRGAPIKVANVTTQDPFTESVAQIDLPMVTMFDSTGEGDLDWLVEDSAIDIVWQNTGEYVLDWRWEGYIGGENFSLGSGGSTYVIDVKGCMFGLDNYLAIPGFPKRPIPYEILIAQAFNQNTHPAHLGALRILFPDDWGVKVPEFKDPDYLNFLKPWGVSTGQLWTGYTSRSTGSWEPLLTGHVQSLLSVMFAEGGAQWSIRNRGYRRPELYLREIPEDDSPSIIEINLGAPGVEISGSKDPTQRASVIYGQGVDEAGISYSGMQVSPDGANTYYKPFAFAPNVWPRTNNPSYNKNIRAKEVMIRFQDGVDEISANKIAQGQYHRFSEPGITGSITLTTDPLTSTGELIPRLLIRAGVTLRINGIGGIKEGLLVHVTRAVADFENLTMTMDFDSKYRDVLTVDEVKARTRDALAPMRALQVGKYSNTVQDLVLPWSYKEGSGIIPRGAKEFFNEKLPSTAVFPYEEWTRKHPPSNPAYKNYYVRIGPTNTTNSSKNWSGVARDGQTLMAIPIRMSQSGAIRLTQMAAYDKDGNVKPVRFHLSVYNNNGVATDAMPKFPVDPEPNNLRFLRPNTVAVNYEAFQANPFFENAWEQVKQDGTQYDNASYLTAENAGLVVGWGNYYEPAGYSPGRFSKGANRTGLLEDNAQWSWDLSSFLDLLSPENNANMEYAGMLFVQIYCDEQGPEPIYFMGRFLRVEPGTSS